jgi:prepilin-type N-terminal cleavage/methylation domain-containing protein
MYEYGKLRGHTSVAWMACKKIRHIANGKLYATLHAASAFSVVSNSFSGDIMHTHKRHQSGFTLVEIAIVLVIIGLLLGGVLKGQALIDSAKVKGLANDFNAISTMLNGYQDRFRALPGDDPAAVAHLPTSIQATPATAGTGTINTGTWVGAAAAAAANESSVFWNQVRLAGFSPGDSLVGQSTNAVSGRLGITSGVARPTTPAGVAGSFFTCSSGINGTLAPQIDTAMDDGVATTGSMFGAIEAAGPVVAAQATAAYAAANSYTVCLAF